MKVFALITLRCALIMLLSSFVQNEPLGTLATLALRDWEYSCYKIVNIVSVSPGFITLDPNYINEVIKKPLTDLLNEVNNFPIGGMDELLDRRLKKPLGLAIGNCDQLLNEVEHSGRQDNKKYLESLSSKIRSIAKGIRTEFNTFTMEVELELIKKVNWTFVEQPHIDGDEFIAFCHNFKLEWNQIDQMTRQLTSNDDKDTLRERLDNLAEKAMEETAPLKAIITENFDQLMTKCQNSLGKLYKEEASKQRVAAAKGMGCCGRQENGLNGLSSQGQRVVTDQVMDDNPSVKDNASVDNASEDNPSKDNPSVKDNASVDNPSEDNPSKDNPSVKDNASVDNPSEDNPSVKDNPSEDNPSVKDNASEGNPSEDNPSEDNPSEDNPSEDNPSVKDNASVNNPSEDNPSEDNPSEDNPSEDNPSVKDNASVDNPSEDNPSEDNPSEDIPSEDNASVDNPSEDNPSEDNPSEDNPSVKDNASVDNPSEDNPSVKDNASVDNPSVKDNASLDNPSEDNPSEDNPSVKDNASVDNPSVPKTGKNYECVSSFITLDKPSNILETKKSLKKFLSEVNEFPLKDEMEELLSRRLKKPLKLAIGNCEKILNEVKHSGREDNKKYLESLLSKTSSIANGIDKEFNTFSFEVVLELFTKSYRTLQKRVELANKFVDLANFPNNSYSDIGYFAKEWLKISSGMGNNPCYEPGTPEFVDFVESLILNAKLKILETEFKAKIAGFAQQQPLIDGDGFIAFSHYFKLEWNIIEQMIGQLTSNDNKDTFRKRLDDLAEKAMDETAPLKAIIIEKLGQLMTKCQNSLGKFNKEEISNQPVVTKLKNAIKQLLNPFKSDQQKEEAKKKEIDAMKEFISDIGMFDGAAYKLLVRFEHEEMGKTDFCAELEKAVAEDKQMISTAYQVKDNEL
uniref:Uncharacterized protein n=1 Tax=Globodera rostochiensis TaxID=31243 RepID=A0A914HJ11_GLORO